MTNNEGIDDLFKDIIEPYEMDHSDKVWASLNGHLETKSNKRDKAVIFRLRIAVVILLFLCTSITFYSFFNSTETKITSLVGSSQKLIKNNSKPDQTIALNSIKNKNTNTDQVLGNAEISTFKTSLKIERDQKIKNTPHIKQTKTLAANKSKILTNVVDQKNKNHIDYTDNKIALQTNIPNTINQTASIDSINKSYGQVSKTIINISDSNGVTINNFDTNKVAKTHAPILLLSKEKTDSAQKDQFRNRLSLIAYFSPDITKEYLQDNDKNDDEYEADFESKEVSDFSFNTGFLIGYDLSKNWSLKFGGTYNYLSQTIKPKTIYAKVGTNGLTNYQFNTSYGTSEIPSDKSPQPVLGDSIIINSESFQALQIIGVPLISKYQITRNKFSYYAQAGLSLNFVTGGKLIIELPNKPQTVQKIDGLNKYYFGGLIGIGVAYNPHKKLSILLEPTVRGAITPINNNTPITTRPISLGLTFGLGWHF